MKILDLCGSWQVHQANSEQVLPALVPGTIHQDLLAAGLLEDMNWRDNESRQQWVAEKDWVYRREFTVAADLLACGQVLLECQGLDTLATVLVNGHEVLDADNMFRTWEVDVKPVLVPGTNLISVYFRSTIPYICERNADFRLPCWNSYDPRFAGKSWIRKMPCSYGWDWGLMAATCGIWRGIRLLGVEQARWADVLVRQEHHDGVVDLRVCGKVERLAGQVLRMRCQVHFEDGEVIATDAEITGDYAEEVLRIADPRLWWPNGLGEQHLYHVTVDLVDQRGHRLDRWQRRIGLRTLELDRHKDEWGESFQFVVNGVAFFAKGANWVPADVLIPRLTRADYERLLGAAADANMNMIRAWGGGFYEQDDFFAVCDERGLLVWQDFIFACSTYPAFDPEFMASVEAEARDNIRRLRSHPSLAFWCGNNELEQGLVDDQWTERAMSWEDYKALFDVMLPQLVHELDPDRPYWPGSPHTPHGSRRNFNDPACGDAHCWDVWFGGKPFEYQREWTHRFMSEFGFQSFPEPRTLAAFCAPGDLNLTSYVMDYHQRSANGNRKIFAYLLDWFKMPHGLANTLWMTQVTQAECIRYACEHARRMQPRMMGVIYWQINDIWPAASWSSIDVFGRWKALQYFARRFFSPLLVSMVENRTNWTMAVHVSNHLRETADLRCEWRLTDLAGNELGAGGFPAAIKAQSNREVGVVDCAAAVAEQGERNLILWTRLFQGDELVSANYQTFARPKHLELRDPGLEVKVEQTGENRFAATVTAARPALYVRLELADADAWFGDNFLALAGGESRTIELSPWQPASLADVRARLRVSSLVDTVERF
ncbi:MAG: glycoside hydrolase family 2 protein [Lentisphaeria bacterium]|jgi:beta-mannosidase|nr:glycoside hydrolase family 2 protein [Lentisphaeria bacterium]